jgi:hypothetical protein
MEKQEREHIPHGTNGVTGNGNILFMGPIG